MVIMLYKVILSFESVDEIVKCDHSNEKLLSRGAGSRDGAVVRALTSHQCGPGSNPGLGVICGLSL